MRIISKYQDYYDGVQSMYQYDHVGPTSEVKSVTSDSRPWIRQEVSIDVDKVDLDFKLPHIRLSTHNFCRDIGIGSFIIGFCGKIYSGIVFSGISSMNTGYEKIKEHCYSIEDVDKVIEKLYAKKILSKKDYDFYYETNKKKMKQPYSVFWDKNSSIKHTHMHRVKVAEAFDNVNADTGDYGAYFELEKAPIFTIKNESFTYNPHGRTKKCIVFNPVLKDYSFYKLFDSMAAYQEISMYMSNMCFPEVEINPVPDEIKAESHGFNKYSFRKDPQKKKK